jgi:uncharacterized protein (DUF433 family)
MHRVRADGFVFMNSCSSFQVGSAWLEDSHEDDADGQPIRAVNLKVGQVMDRDFVERRDESFYLVGSRVPLASIVREFQDGQSPEAIRSAFPTLTLEQVYGAITFYLGHRAEVDEDIATREREESAFSETHPAPADLKEKLDRARRQPQSR